MIAIAWKILKGMIWKDSRLNPVGTFLTLAIAGYTAVLANNAYQRNVGRRDVATKIEKKVEANVKATDAARARSRSGTGGVRDPYLRD